MQHGRLCSCGTRTYLLCGRWNLPRIKLVSPALASRLLSTAATGEVLTSSFLLGDTSYCPKLSCLFSCICCCCLVAKLYVTLSRPHGLYPAQLPCPLDFSGQNTRVHCHALLQGVFPTQESNSVSSALAGGSSTLAPPGKLVEHITDTQYSINICRINE